MIAYSQNRILPLNTLEKTVSAPIEEVWRRVSEVERNADFMEPVQKVTVLTPEADISFAAWEVVLKGLLKWIEHEILYPHTYLINFTRVDCDLEAFDGCWQLFRLEQGLSRAVLLIQFETGIPMLHELLDPVAERALIENSRLLLRSLSGRNQ